MPKPAACAQVFQKLDPGAIARREQRVLAVVRDRMAGVPAEGFMNTTTGRGKVSAAIFMVLAG